VVFVHIVHYKHLDSKLVQHTWTFMCVTCRFISRRTLAGFTTVGRRWVCTRPGSIFCPASARGCTWSPASPAVPSTVYCRRFYV